MGDWRQKSKGMWILYYSLGDPAFTINSDHLTVKFIELNLNVMKCHEMELKNQEFNSLG